MWKRYALLAATLGLLCAPANATQQQNFWTWFVDNREFLENYNSNTAAVTQAVGRRLQNVDRGLTYEMGQAADGVYEFIVSANGVRDVFPEVNKLVRVAPEIEGWRIIAFRPRGILCSLHWSSSGWWSVVTSSARRTGGRCNTR